MKKTLLIIFAVLSLQVIGQKQDDAVNYASSITEEDLKEHLYILASDALEGRETGERGQKMAAAYIKAHFQQLGLTGPVNSEYGDGHYQRVPLYTLSPGNIYLKANGNSYNNFEDIVYFGSSSSGKEVETNVVFAGNGSDEALDGIDFDGAAALVYMENMRDALRGGSENIMKKGATMLFVLSHKTDEDFKKTAQQYKQYLSNGRLSVEKPKPSENGGVFFVSPTVASQILGTDTDKLFKAIEQLEGSNNKGIKKIKPGKAVYHTHQNSEVLRTENVLGYLEGTDKKDEVIVITAHYDHVGTNGEEIYNGADDDGSGTVAVLEVAEAFAKAKAEGKGPRRSVLFMTVTGEEKGLLGSSYYTSNPVFPLENTVANLNIDMVGRIDPNHEGKGDYIYLIGSDKLSSELHELSELANSTYTNMELDYTYNDEGHPQRFYYRSDHWNFAKNNIPIIFYFNGTHEDYHQPTDTPDKIEYGMLAKRAQLVFHTAWVLANREERIVVDKIKETSVEERK